jgi:hypothetical protein
MKSGVGIQGWNGNRRVEWGLEGGMGIGEWNGDLKCREIGE